nr:MAG TPA: hypothetical protein [Caudoviricetes sp.]DAM07183.1 MAG TPA: hypothetical protein [Caudoviricetes sp.]
MFTFTGYLTRKVLKELGVYLLFSFHTYNKFVPFDTRFTQEALFNVLNIIVIDSVLNRSALRDMELFYIPNFHVIDRFTDRFVF